jgi:hypothetical protein
LKRLRALAALALGVLALVFFAFPEREAARGAESTGTVWSSRAACLRALSASPSPRAAGVARIGAWNLHWFPDGRPGKPNPGEGTDLEWLACAIAWLRVDVLAVSEVKHGAHVKTALDDLVTHLSKLTNGSWSVLLDDCPRSSSQHVGLLYDASRARFGKSATLGMLNPHGEPCRDQLRPGLAGTFRFPGGLDLSVVATHLKSGSERRSLDLRAQSFAAFGPAAAAATALAGGDSDVLLIGDMNSMGCRHCSPPVSAPDELATIDRALSGASPKLRRLPASRSCSHHYSGDATLLDWAAGSDLGELPSGSRLVVSGYCAELGCSGKKPPKALDRLSDHCPVYVDVPDVDRDGEAR